MFGMDCWRDSRRVKVRVGYLPGDLRLYPWMNGRSALAMFGAARGRDLRGEGRELAARFELDLDVKVRKMSRGMRQKLGLILAMAHRPPVLVLDEPTASLDPLMQEELRRLLRDWRQAGHTIFFSSHTLSEVEQLCDRVAILREGRLVVDATLDELRGRSRQEVVIRWANEAAAGQDTPAFLELRERRGSEWNCVLSGPVMELVRWAGTQPIADLAIGHPDLEALFQRYYRGGEGQREGGSGRDSAIGDRRSAISGQDSAISGQRSAISGREEGRP